MTPAPERHNLFKTPDRLDFHDAVVAIIRLDDGRFLMQLRDDKPGIFYPDHWGLFGGAVEPGETPEEALRREIREELGFDLTEATYVTRMDFDFERLGAGRCYRLYYEVLLAAARLPGLLLGEGRLMQPLALPDLLLCKRVVPYDAFALWMYDAARRLTSSDPRTCPEARS